MDIMAYYLVLSNLQALGSRGPGIEDLTMKVADLSSLADYLKNYPQFDIESFEQNHVNRVGDMGLFISNNLRLFCLNGIGDPNDEGVVVTFNFKMRGSSSDKEPNVVDHTIFIRKQGLSEDIVRPLLQELSNLTPDRNRLIVIRDPKA